LYPTAFRRAFGQELATTFRNRVEDVLNDGGIVDWLTFSGHIIVDWIRTCSDLLMESGAHRSEWLELTRGTLASASSRLAPWQLGVWAWIGIVGGWFTLVAALAYPALSRSQAPKPTWLVAVFGWYAMFSAIGVAHRITANWRRRLRRASACHQ
jgi:hypothetical protein